ncbi:MAG: hypothetical protein JWN98_2118, partial [Abditibacteriota bacterium]|nr:hypothetical protein [Abditibacteriota bacterium]
VDFVEILGNSENEACLDRVVRAQESPFFWVFLA